MAHMHLKLCILWFYKILQKLRALYETAHALTGLMDVCMFECSVVSPSQIHSSESLAL